MSVATDQDGSHLLIGDASIRTPEFSPSRPFAASWNDYSQINWILGRVGRIRCLGRSV